MSKPCSIRIPTELQQQLEAAAAAERRSFSGQVLVLLETGIEARRRAQEAAEQALIAELVEQFDATLVHEEAA